MNGVAILGGGISGLTLGYLLKQKNISFTVFERTHRAGGCISSKAEGGFLVEFGPNTILNNEPKTFQLIESLGLTNQIIESKDVAKDRYIYSAGKLQRVPTSPKDLFKSTLISWPSKFKIFKEYKFPPTLPDSTDTRSLYDLIVDHFGTEVAETLFRPMMMGIWGGDAKNLSANKSFPKLVQYEKEYKSLTQAFKTQATSGKKLQSVSLKNGLQALTDSLVKNIGSQIKLNSYVTRIDRKKDHYILHFQDEVEGETYSEYFEKVVVCLPPQAMSEILVDVLDEVTLEKLNTFPMAPIKSLSIAFSQPTPFSGFGALVSPKEDLKILGFLHPKDIFPFRSPENKDLLTVMLGGVFQPQAVNWSLQNSIKIAIENLEKILGKLPPVEKYWVWNHVPGIPQYNTDWVDFMGHIEGQVQATSGLYLNSTLTGGVSVNDCIRKSYALAEQFKPEDFKGKPSYEFNLDDNSDEEEV